MICEIWSFSFSKTITHGASWNRFQVDIVNQAIFSANSMQNAKFVIIPLQLKLQSRQAAYFNEEEILLALVPLTLIAVEHSLFQKPDFRPIVVFPIGAVADHALAVNFQSIHRQRIDVVHVSIFVQISFICDDVFVFWRRETTNKCIA